MKKFKKKQFRRYLFISKQAIKYAAGVKQRMSEASIVDSVQRESGQKPRQNKIQTRYYYEIDKKLEIRSPVMIYSIDSFRHAGN